MATFQLEEQGLYISHSISYLLARIPSHVTYYTKAV
jgi:hypothetical protein